MRDQPAGSEGSGAAGGDAAAADEEDAAGESFEVEEAMAERVGKRSEETGRKELGRPGVESRV